MGTIAILIIGLVLGAAVFLVLFQKGYLDNILDLRQRAPQIQNSDIVDSVINIRVNNDKINYDEESKLYKEYCELIKSIKFSKDFDAEKAKLRAAYDLVINELRSSKEIARNAADNQKSTTITLLEQEFAEAQKIKNRTKGDADSEWNKFGNERERERVKARNEYDKKLQEIDKLHENRRSAFYKKKQDADNEYINKQQIYYRNKQIAQDLASNTKSKIDITFNTSKDSEYSMYKGKVNIINSSYKKELLENITPEQNLKFKKFIINE